MLLVKFFRSYDRTADDSFVVALAIFADKVIQCYMDLEETEWMGERVGGSRKEADTRR